jgi:4-alpha-glucanotransferase
MAASVEKVRFLQYLLFRQSRSLKNYANARGLRLIGDMPFFVSPDSSDVWARPEYFLLDESLRPRVVAGAPPDQYNSLGQRWGNPVYNWEALREGAYQWCIDRFRAALSHVDVLHLDHFRGFAAAWHVPAGAPMARCGQWVHGPGARLFEAVQADFDSLPFIAEDLGMITADVWHLLEQIEAPGTRVLQYAFDGHSDNPHLPDNFVLNTAAYTGTQNNPSTRGWYETLPPNERRNLWRYLRRPGGDAADVAPALIRLTWASKAALSIAPLQDLLNLAPDIEGGNRSWRVTPEMTRASVFDWLRQLTQATKRAATLDKPVPAPKLFEMVR